MKIAVIGLGTFGQALVEELAEHGHEIVAIDLAEEPVRKVKDVATLAVIADASDENVVKELALGTMDLIAVAIGKGFEASMMVTTRLRQLSGPLLAVRAISELHAKLLEMTGVNRVLRVEALAARELSNRVQFHQYIRHFVIDHNHVVAEIAVPERFVGKSLREIDLGAKEKLLLIAILHRTAGPAGNTSLDVVESIPDPGRRFEAEDILTLYGREADLRAVCSRWEVR
jgi:trk system potassium uptake protein TrkA